MATRQAPMSGYQAFVKPNLAATLFLALLLFQYYYAARMRANSKEANSSKSLAIMTLTKRGGCVDGKHQVQWRSTGIPITAV